MVDRILHYFDWEFERVDMVGLTEFVLRENPQLFDTQVPIKAYEVVPHGTNPDIEVEMANVSNLRQEVELFRQRIFREKPWVSWQSGIGGVFYRDNVPVSFVPMIDLELVSSQNIEVDTKRLEAPLEMLGMYGSIVRSGDRGVGGYFFVGHKVLPYTPEYWRFMGRVLKGFSFGESENAINAREIGDGLIQANSLQEANGVATKIQVAFPTIKTGETREGLLCDPRWIYHKLLDGYTILRESPGKSYQDRPLQVAEYI
jgi:hypothetical protein